MLRMLLNRIRLRLQCRRRQAHGDAQARKMRAAFAIRYRDILDACLLLREEINIRTDHLAYRYMSSVIGTQQDDGWWTEHSRYLAEPWFIYEYACENGLIRRKERAINETPALHAIEPENAAHDGYVIICVHRKTGSPSIGDLVMEYLHADEAFRRIAWQMKFVCEGNGYKRIITETDGAICDRVVESAVGLLQQGYRVCVDEPVLKERILAEDFEPEHRYWVLEGADVDRLELRYPHDKQLHGYVYKAGGRWNGKTVEISICNSHKLGDLIRLYGFRLTEGARARMEAWQEMIDSTTIYRQRRRRSMYSELPPIDRFRQLMEQKTKIIEDLYENDE